MRRRAALVSGVLVVGAVPAFAGTIPVNFSEYGTAVSGYQDHFDGSALASGWSAVGATSFSVSGGLLHAVLNGYSDPSKLLYAGESYDGVDQNVLALIRVNSASGDSRVGVSASNTSSGLGMNLMFRGAASDGNVSFLDDYVAHGPQNSFAWYYDTFYWLRIVHAATVTYGKVWLGDGTTAEPTSFMFGWSHTDGRSGLAGIQSTVYTGSLDFDVDYILIQAGQLPQIDVVNASAVPLPAAAWTGLATLGLLSIGARLRSRRRALVD